MMVKMLPLMSDRVLECQKLKRGGLNALVDSFLEESEKSVGLNWLKNKLIG